MPFSEELCVGFADGEFEFALAEPRRIKQLVPVSELPAQELLLRVWQNLIIAVFIVNWVIDGYI